MSFEKGPIEHCGVVGIIDFEGREVVRRAVVLLDAVQHRGQDAAGILTFNHGPHVYRKFGKVNQIFTPETIEDQNLEGPLAIGHNRYRTQGGKTLRFVQPILAHYKELTLASAHNGNISQVEKLKERVEGKGIFLKEGFDSLYLPYLIITAAGNSWIEKIQNGLLGVEGSYSMTLATDDGHLLAVRDPWGNRPLSWALIDGGAAVASESVAFPQIGQYKYKEVEPGQIIDISKEGIFTSELLERPKRRGFCSFEPIYFAYETSVLNGETVSGFRERLGMSLAINHPTEAKVVSAIPESSSVAAASFAHTSRLPIRRLILKKPAAINRSFMQGEMGNRTRELENKFNISPEARGEDVMLVDDSVIIGNTTKVVAMNMRTQVDIGSVEVGSTAPKVVEDCELGVNMRSDDGQFVALENETGRIRSNEEIAKIIGIKKISYLTLDELKEVIKLGGNNPENFCYKCFGGEGIEKAERLDYIPDVKRFDATAF